MSKRMIPTAAAILLCVAAVRADDLVINKMTYAGSTIKDVKDGQVFFTGSSGNLLSKNLKDLNSVSVVGNEDFNGADKALADKQYDAAVEGFQKAEKKAPSGGWFKKLIHCRLCVALDQAGKTGAAAEQWLAVMDEQGGSELLAPLAPKNLAAKGSKENAKAMQLLESKSHRVSDKAYLMAIQRLLMDLYKHEELADKSAALAKEIAGGAAPGAEEKPAAAPAKPAPAQPAGSGEAPKAAAPEAAVAPAAAATPATPSAGGSVMEVQLKAEAMIQSGQAAKAVSMIEDGLGQYGAAELPAALLMLGKAHIALADKADGDDKQKHNLAAGLSLMRVATYFGESAEAPEALCLAGKVNEALGNVKAAQKAYDAVLAGYGTSPWASTAKAALASLTKK